MKTYEKYLCQYILITTGETHPVVIIGSTLMHFSSSYLLDKIQLRLTLTSMHFTCAKLSQLSKCFFSDFFKMEGCFE